MLVYQSSQLPSKGGTSCTRKLGPERPGNWCTQAQGWDAKGGSNASTSLLARCLSLGQAMPCRCLKLLEQEGKRTPQALYSRSGAWAGGVGEGKGSIVRQPENLSVITATCLCLKPPLTALSSLVEPVWPSMWPWGATQKRIRHPQKV